VSAATVTHPHAPGKWVVSLHGNGEYLEAGFGAKLQLAYELGCSVIACDYRGVGRSRGLLLSGSAMVSDAARCVAYCEGQLAAGTNPVNCILLLGQSMGGGVVSELAAYHYPHLPCVNQRSFAALTDVSCCVLGLYHRTAARWVVHYALAAAFNSWPWCIPFLPCGGPLSAADDWSRLPSDNKMILYHADDHVIGAAGLCYELERRSKVQSTGLAGTKVVRLRGHPRDAHNEDPARFSPQEWAEAVVWMQRKLELEEVENTN